MKWESSSGADPGFNVGGGANPWGAPTYDFAKISEKLHEIEKILVRMGGGGLRSAAGHNCYGLSGFSFGLWFFIFYYYYFPFFGYLGNPSVNCYFFVTVYSLEFTCHFITGSQHLKFSCDYRVPHQLEMERYRWCSRSPQAVPVYRQWLYVWPATHVTLHHTCLTSMRGLRTAEVWNWNLNIHFQ